MDRGGPEVGRDGILLKWRNYCDPISLIQQYSQSGISNMFQDANKVNRCLARYSPRAITTNRA